MNANQLTYEQFVRAIGQEPYVKVCVPIAQVEHILKRYFINDIKGFSYQSEHFVTYVAQSGEKSLCLAMEYRRGYKRLTLIFDFCSGEMRKILRENFVGLPRFYGYNINIGMVYKNWECVAYIDSMNKLSVWVNFFPRKSMPSSRLEAERMARAFMVTQIDAVPKIQKRIWSPQGIQVRQITLENGSKAYASLLDEDNEVFVLIGTMCYLVKLDCNYVSEFL